MPHFANPQVEDHRLILASEVGVVDVAPEEARDFFLMSNSITTHVLAQVTPIN